MTNKLKTFQKEIRSVFAKVKKHKSNYEIEVSGKKIVIFPNVFSPAYFTDSEYFAEELPKIVKNKSFLEIGLGTGIISLFCALNGAKVTGIDINSLAVANTQANFKNHNLSINALLGDVYSPLGEEDKFDFIFWNHPFNNGNNPDEEVLLKAGFDYKFQSLERYISEAKKHLNPKGRLLLGTGSFADVESIKRIAKKYGYKLKILEKKEFPVEFKGKMMNAYLIYEFVI